MYRHTLMYLDVFKKQVKALVADGMPTIPRGALTFRLLITLKQTGAVTIPDLLSNYKTYFGKKTTAGLIYNTLTRLERQGYLNKHTHMDNERELIVELTDYGNQLVTSLVELAKLRPSYKNRKKK